MRIGTMISLLNPHRFAGGGGPFDPTSYFSGSVTEGWWPTDDAATLWTSASRTTNVTDGVTVGLLDNADSGGVALIAASSGVESAWSESTGLLVGTGDIYDVAIATQGSDMYFACIIEKVTDSIFSILRSTANFNKGIEAQNSDASAVSSGMGGSVVVTVNGGSALTTRDALHDAIAAVGGPCVVEAYNLDLSNADFSSLRMSNGNTVNYGDFLLMSNPGATARGEILIGLAARHSITL